MGSVGSGGSSSAAQNNAGATKSAAETSAMSAANSAFSGCTTNVDHCVQDQFTYTGPGGTCTVKTVGGTTLDTVLAGFTGTISGSPVGCNDDFGGVQSQFSFTAATGQTYAILKCTFGTTAQGAMTVTVTC